ncbi:MAG TPA: ABC transporter ATP-binding protein [Deltaproteobacteria bacterium]|nr:ABC transporter ATP-binding protein [Deltaproteobacteria bacterium]
MITLSNLSKRYGEKLLFERFSFRINEDSRVALLGANGAGKSTLLKIIAGSVEPDSGSVSSARTVTVGYLPQDGVYHRGLTLLEETWTAFEDILRLENEIADLTNQIRQITAAEGPSSPALTALVVELGRAQHDMEHREGYRKASKIKEILFGLGFTESDLHRKTEEFSGGWHMRIEMAKLLLTEPSVLLLDEPTNHLDLESLEWIEEYLRSYRGALLIVSHDSRFLDNLVNQVLEVARGGITAYSGNYSSYLLQRETRRKITEASRENQQKLIERTNRFVERFCYKNTKASQVQSRLKMLEKLQHIQYEVEQRDIAFSFPDPPRAGRIIMELTDLVKSYGDVTVFGSLSLVVNREDRIACIGVNGSGKSTLARIIAGIEPFNRGERLPGHNVHPAYYSQNMADALHPDKTVLETLSGLAPEHSSGALRTLLGSFLFSGDDVFKPVSVLSGGEKSRLALAKMLLEPANFLILDEPTNHLDARSKTVLQRRLLDYPGTLFIVSHDRDFLAPLVNRVVAVGRGRIDEYPGSLEDYLERLHRLREAEENTQTVQPPETAATADRDRKRREARLRQKRYRKIKPLRESITAVEHAIQDGESRKTEIEAAFADRETFSDERLIQSLQKEHAELAANLESLYDEWTRKQEALETVEREYDQNP